MLIDEWNLDVTWDEDDLDVSVLREAEGGFDVPEVATPTKEPVAKPAKAGKVSSKPTAKPKNVETQHKIKLPKPNAKKRSRSFRGSQDHRRSMVVPAARGLPSRKARLSTSFNYEGSAFKCPHCPKLFPNRVSARYHAFSCGSNPTQGKPFPCTQCDKSYILARNLKNHMDTRHNNF